MSVVFYYTPMSSATRVHWALDELLRVLDGALAGRQFLLGDAFSIVECTVAAVVAFVGRLGVELWRHGNVSAWTERCMARPALSRAIAG